jgi:hypothetical protein
MSADWRHRGQFSVGGVRRLDGERSVPGGESSHAGRVRARRTGPGRIEPGLIHRPSFANTLGGQPSHFAMGMLPM